MTGICRYCGAAIHPQGQMATCSKCGITQRVNHPIDENKTECQNPFCPKCHPDAFHKLEMDLNTLNAIGVGLAGARGHNPLLCVQQDFTLLFDYINTNCHE